MVRWTHAEELAYAAKQPKLAPASPDAVPLESPLHRDIIAWCNAQHPRWKYVHARTDKRSTIGEGVADFTIFGPYPLCVVVELKRKAGKLSQEQTIWNHEMSRLGWRVAVARSMTEFLQCVEDCKKCLTTQGAKEQG